MTTITGQDARDRLDELTEARRTGEYLDAEEVLNELGAMLAEAEDKPAK